MSLYDEHETDSAVAAEIAERAALAENSVDTVDLGFGRTLIRLLHREGDSVRETFIDPDDYAPQPRWKSGRVELITVPSLIAYAKKHIEAGTEVWALPDAGRFEAVIDDHRPGAEDGQAHIHAGWGDYRAVCQLQQTRDWKHWTSLDGKLVDQLAFAEHLEAGLHNIVDPPAADLLEVAQTLHGSRNVAWKSGARLSDGQVQLRYEEELQGRAGAAANLEIPQTFTLALAPFEGTEAAQVTASLRWRLNDGQVRLGYRLQRPDVVLREVVDLLIDQIESELEVRVLLGKPRPARSPK